MGQHRRKTIESRFTRLHRRGELRHRARNGESYYALVLLYTSGRGNYICVVIFFNKKHVRSNFGGGIVYLDIGSLDPTWGGPRHYQEQSLRDIFL